MTSPHAAGSITSKNAAEARKLPGVALVLLAEDLGDKNRFRPLRADEPLLADHEVSYLGQPVGIVVADTREHADAAAALVEVRYHVSPATTNLEHALALQHFHGEATSITRGDPGTAIGKSPHTFEGTLDIGSQLPFAGEPLWARATPTEDHSLIIQTPAELPSRVRAAIASAVKVPESHIEVVPARIEGLSGGRQSEAAYVATLAAIAAKRTGRPIRLELSRTHDLAITAKRHALKAEFEVGYNDEGLVLGADITLTLDGGHRRGDSDTALDQAMLHGDGAYFVADFRVTGRLCRTNHVTGSSLPAEGAAQGAMVMEEILSQVAHRLGLPTEKVRETNLYRETDNRHSTPYGQPVDCDPLQRLWSDLLNRSDFAIRRDAIIKANAINPCYKRGIAVVPAKFGVGDPRAERNQAMVLVQLLVDGSVCVRLGCIDAGDGLSQRVAEEAAAQFGVHPSQVVVRCGDLHCTPHMCARIGSDTVGLMRRAVADASAALKSRLRPIAAQMLAASGANEIDAETIRFADGKVGTGAQTTTTLTFGELVDAAWRRRTNMTAIGYHRTPNLWWDREIGAGWPFSGFVYGVAVVEVQLDAFTGEVQVLRADIMHQGSSAVGASHDRAQIARALQLGLGWMLHETVAWNTEGALCQDSARSYAIPGFGDAPLQLEIDLVPSPNQPSEFAAASGAESAVFLASAAREATREAIRAFGTPVNRHIEVFLPAPATPAAVLAALREMSGRLTASAAGG
ncbi:MAG: molybdopterin-dependent oxidoreductase [Verrucomicrobiae bacterium]|nr:molybdopterin-dependent oxidoreductase [Verrucomicrobiae bacterium]